MSSQRGDPKKQDCNKLPGRVVTDSVHTRFRSIQVHCNTCNMDFVGNPTAISSHFNSSHPSTEFCFYCKGKVFKYTQIPIDGSNVGKPDIVYHECRKSYDESEN